ncbi:NAD(P)H-dependent oxidoreductase [Nonomuraea sp. NPDC005983]|uniref:NADPH-dependent FMN reductase n=1 Tax=Nonomuraea sp. NPDC005983 TaxID=3155595 RepID=UPI0033B49610
MRVIGIAAGFHAGSFNNRLLEAAARELPAWAEFESWQGLGDIPPFTSGPVPGPVGELRKTLDESDAVLVTAPEYCLLPAELYHALNWLRADRALAGRHVAVVCASARACGAMWAQTELVKEFTAAGAVVVGSELVVTPSGPYFDDRGSLLHRGLLDQVREVIGQLCPAPVRRPPPVRARALAREPALSL